MSVAQQARVAGFRASLGVRGISVTLMPDRGVFAALVEHFASPQPGMIGDSGPRVLEADERTADRLAILHDDLGETQVEIGDVFRDTEGNVDYRVVRIERGGIDVAARFTCEKEALS